MVQLQMQLFELFVDSKLWLHFVKLFFCVRYTLNKHTFQTDMFVLAERRDRTGGRNRAAGC